ncbi:prepilin-type N-terminal cleavage/methylation domain-containing protein, partial [Candidatus Peregrinibacteria bacterium]|nr:prepilin-type N-terminal cleavage/methylation domain-containing protein [Candidatus Peregrinibacteria bacterium]
MKKIGTRLIICLKKAGFSLVELILVIAIIAILASVAFLSIQRVRERSYNDKNLGSITAIANALEQYAIDHDGQFPGPAAGG